MKYLENLNKLWRLISTAEECNVATVKERRQINVGLGGGEEILQTCCGEQQHGQETLPAALLRLEHGMIPAKC